jgi:hypothetical protein
LDYVNIASLKNPLIAISGTIMLYIIRKLFSTVELPTNEPNAAEISSNLSLKLIILLLLPFEIIVENLVIIPDFKRKVYSLSESSKIFFSPVTFSLFVLWYRNDIMSISSLLVAIVVSMAISISLFSISRKINYPYILNLYSFSILLAIQSLIFNQILKTVMNISYHLEIDAVKTISLMIIPIFSLPSLSIQSSFIKRGFFKQSLYSFFYFPCLNVYINCIIIQLLKTFGLITGFSYNEDMKTSFYGSMGLLFISLIQIYSNDNKFTSAYGILGPYSIIQDAIISITKT